MEKLVLESSINGCMGGRSLKSEANNRRGYTTDWKIDKEAPRVNISGQVQSKQGWSGEKDSPVTCNNKEKAREDC